MTTSDLERAIEAHFGVVPDEVQQAIDALKTASAPGWCGDEAEARAWQCDDSCGEHRLDLIRRAKAHAVIPVDPDANALVAESDWCGDEVECEVYQWSDELLPDLIRRAKAEGARGMRERCAKAVSHSMYAVDKVLALPIETDEPTGGGDG